jgi:hypothetical protein
MSYESIDQLQKVLTEEVFHYAKDSKKAAGRALGTIVEIITFYLLESWGFNKYISIERSLTEYGNLDISHNVEYSLHPVINEYAIQLPFNSNSITSAKIIKELKLLDNIIKKNTLLISGDKVLRNGCMIGSHENSLFIASIEQDNKSSLDIVVYQQQSQPFAMFECKRVGVEEGMKKGPQTIEKAKQGAYVAKSVSSLQKVRLDNGDLYGIIYDKDNNPYSKPYIELLEEVINSNDSSLLKKFILTVGVVSNHGNWFTAQDHNKELKVLAQSYDWLIFLTDAGLAQFITEVILSPEEKYSAIKAAFLSSYTADKKKNTFTKVQMQYEAHSALLDFFCSNSEKIETWFNVISPYEANISRLKNEIDILANKNWQEIRK